MSYASFFAEEWMAKAAPCGSMHCAIQSPPGTSMGPFNIWPPSSLTFSTTL